MDVPYLLNRILLVLARFLLFEFSSHLLQDHFQRLRQAYPGSKLLIVSNTAGTASDVGFKQSAVLEANTGVKVLQHSTKKPGCKDEVMAYFRAHPDSGVTRPDQIAIVGDRLSTDIMMANMMGSYGFWIRDGAVRPGFVSSIPYLQERC